MRVFLISLLLVIALTQPGANAATDPAQLRIQFPGVGRFGIFDPSVTEDPTTKRLWMSFSAVDPSTHSKWGVGLRLAWSDDGGESWRDAGVLERFVDVTVGPLETTAEGEAAIDEKTRGTWQNETSTLIYDRDAAASARWKVFWHQALWADDTPRYASYSWIAMKAADTPEHLATATAVKLFTGYLAKSDGEKSDAPAFAPIAGPATIPLDRKDASLGACVFGEPAALSGPDGLYLALDCQWLGAQVQPHTVLLRCSYPGCNVTDASTWTVVSRLTEPRDAKRLDEKYKGFGGTALVEKNGKYFLLATPVETSGTRYDGCNAYAFTDLTHGVIARSRSKLAATTEVHGIPGTHHGACAYHEHLRHGILLSQLVTSAAPAMFQIRGTDAQLR
jgi:hypothetical protein